MKKLFCFIFLLLFTVTLLACDKNKDGVKPESISFNNIKTVYNVDDTFNVSPVVKPTNAKYDKIVVECSDEDVISITDGKATCLKEGNVTLTCFISNYKDIKATIDIAVTTSTVVEPTSLEITYDNLIVLVNETIQLGKIITPSNDYTCIWSSSNENIATVDGNGLVTGIGNVNGTNKCDIKCKISGFNIEKTVTVTVLNEIVPLTDFSLSVKDGSSVCDTLVVGHTFKISASVVPAIANYYNFEYESNDENIVTIDKQGIITCNGIGSCTITVTDKNTHIERSIDIVISSVPTLTDFSISSRTITVGDRTSITVNVTPKYALYDIEWSVDDESVATIENGLLSALKVGTVHVTALEKTLNKTCKIDINIEAPFDPNAKPTSITLTGETECYVGYTIPLTAQVYPAGVSQNVVWTISCEEGSATIDENGVLTGLRPSIVRILCSSAVDNSIKSNVLKVRVLEAPVDTVFDLHGYNIVILNAQSALSDIDPFLSGYSSSDKSYKQRAWREVSEDFNCSITVDAYPDTAPWGPQRRSWIINNAVTNSSSCDFAVVSAAWLPQFVQSSACVDCTKFFKDYGKNQITSSLKEAGTYKNKFYIMSTGINDSENYVYKGLYYNYGLIKRLNLESPAKLFNEGHWTYEDFVNYCKQAQALLEKDNYVMSGGPSIVWAGMVNASGVKVADTSTLELNLTHQYSIDAINALKEIVSSKAWDIDNINYDEKVVSFREQRAIFQPGEYWFVRSENRWGSKLFGEDTKYGYVPFPYPASVGKDNTMINQAGKDSVLMMTSGRQHSSDVTYEKIYCALLNVYIKSTKYLKEDTAFNILQSRSNALKAKLDDPESITAALFFNASKTLYDPIFDESFQTEYSSETTTAVINSVKGADGYAEFDKIYSAVYVKFCSIYA